MGCAASTEGAALGANVRPAFEPAPDPAFDSAAAYELHPDVALRPEPFGALAYHYGNRRLIFLRSPILVDLVKALAAHESVDASMAALGVAEAQRPAMAQAVGSLAQSGVVRKRDSNDA